MTTRAIFGVAAMAALLLAATGHCRGTGVDADLGDAPFNAYRTIGSHNSYHVEPEPAVQRLLLDSDNARVEQFARDVRYTHPSLTKQFDLGVRQIELDIFIDRDGRAFASPAAERAIAARGGHLLVPRDPAGAMRSPGFKVMHDPDADWRSTCLTLAACLSEIQTWSGRHPGHFPIIVNLDLKSGPSLPIAGQTASVIEAFDMRSVEDLEQAIRGHLDPARLISPDTIRGRYASPRARIVAEGWPRLSAMRGKILLVLTNDAIASAYRVPDAALKGRLFFPIGPAGEPGSLFVERLDPASPDISGLVCAGYIVQTTADYLAAGSTRDNQAGRDQAMHSGAQGISTNYVVPDPRAGPYVVRFGNEAAGFRYVQRVSPSLAAAACPTPALPRSKCR